VSLPVRTVEGNVQVFDLSGELDRLAGLKDFNETAATLRPAADTRVVLNFRDVTYVCSEAVGAVCAMVESIRRAGGKAVVCALNGLPKDVFNILGVPKIIPTFDAEDQAVAAVLKSGSRKARSAKS